MMVLGIDPGLKGGYFLTDSRTPLIYNRTPVNGKEIDIGHIRDAVTIFGTPDRVIIEKVHAMPGNGVVSMFTFGDGYGQLKGMCKALDWPLYLVRPQQWKKDVLSGTKKDKAAAINCIKNLYPSVNLILPRCSVPHDGVADAACLAVWGTLYA